MAKTFRLYGNPGEDMYRKMDTRGNLIYSDAEVAAINEEQGRVRISGAESEMMIGLLAATNMIQTALPVLEQHALYSGVRKWFRMARSLLRKVCVAMNMKVEARQMASMCNQLRDHTISVSAMPIPGMVNISCDDLMLLCNRAMETCEMVCNCTREESKRCPVRGVMDRIPGAKDAAKEIARMDSSRCPYKGIEVELDG